MDKELTIHRNIRKSENDFTMDFPCDFCNRFTTQVIELPNTQYGKTPVSKQIDPDPTDGREVIAMMVTFPKKICRNCLEELIVALDKNMVDNFENDFNEAREEDQCNPHL